MRRGAMVSVKIHPTISTNGVAVMTNLAQRSVRPSQPLVLVVDDEPGIVKFLRFALEDNGYRVETARDGIDALAKVDREQPTFVLTDLMMPRVNGWELCRRLRERRPTRIVPIVGMSAVDSSGAPFDAFLRKPFELDDLLGVLSHFTEQHDANGHHAAATKRP